MSNIYVQNQQDPILFSNKTVPNYSQDYMQMFQNHMPRMIEPVQVRDYMQELDNATKSLPAEVMNALNDNSEYLELSASLQASIQEEIMTLIKNKLNSNSVIVANAKRQMQIIKDVENGMKEEERKSLMELNDYMKNYSHLSFDEYKNLRENEIVVEDRKKK